MKDSVRNNKEKKSAKKPLTNSYEMNSRLKMQINVFIVRRKQMKMNEIDILMS